MFPEIITEHFSGNAESLHRYDLFPVFPLFTHIFNRGYVYFPSDIGDIGDRCSKLRIDASDLSPLLIYVINT